jgi:heterodisulfide reductase subunit C
MEKRKIDKELMKALFITCLDVVELSKYLPASRRKALSYESKKVEIDAFSKELAETVVATRNQVAHAKSNYQPAANELRVDELPAFNEFLRVAAAQTIRWYNRLPEHQKIASA